MQEPILIVEDNAGDVFLCREYLNLGELRYHELKVAGSLEEARTILSRMRPMVVLLDLSLPDSTGMATYNAMAGMVDAPVIILSGLSDQEVALDLVKSGAQDYLIKGAFDERMLEKAVSYAVERHRHMADMRRTSAMYRLLFDSNPTPMWAMDAASHGILMVNDAAIAHYGYSRDEFLRMTPFDICVAEECDRMRERLADHHANGMLDLGEWRHKLKDGRVIDVVVVVDDIELEERPARLTVLHDITDRKREEQHLKLLRSVVEHARDAIMITEAEPKSEPGPRIVYTNPAFTEQTGYMSTEVEGRSPRFLQGEGTDRRELDRIREALVNWEPVDCELLNYDRKGVPFWVQMSIFPVADNTGWYTNWVSVQRDVTEKKRQELELLELNQSLDLKVQERTRQLSEANAQLVYSHGQITDSIRYAQRIQQAILRRPERIVERFPDAFCLDLPRDLLSGDFHWHHEQDGVKWIAVADCTGHGVPGAIMSIIGNDLLHRAIVEGRSIDPSKVLEHMNEGLLRLLRAGVDGSDVKDGMDIAICAIDEAQRQIHFAGALRPLWIMGADGSDIREVAGNRTPIGELIGIGERVEFKRHILPYTPGTRIYMSSDGFYSQFGGHGNRKLLKKRFVDILRSFGKDVPMVEQGAALEHIFHQWKQDNDQVDDVLVVGIRL